MRRRRGLLVGVGVAVLAVVALAAWLVGSRVRSADQAAANAAPPPRALVTAPVELRVLASTVVVRGDVVPAVSTELFGPSPEDGADAIVTAVFVEPGGSVAEGERIVEVSGRPVFVVEGSVPGFRSLRPGMSGTDVAQLQAALARSGCQVASSGLFDAATKRCVAQLYADAGYEVVLSSDTEAADLAAAGSAVADAEDALEQAQSDLAAAREAASGSELLSAEAAVAAAQRDLDAAVADRDTTVGEAVEEVDQALADLNAVVVAANPSAAAAGGSAGQSADSAASGGAGSSSGSNGGGGGGGGGAVSDRERSAAELVSAFAGVDEAQRAGDAAVTAASDALRLAQADLEELTAPPDVAAEQLAVTQAEEKLERAEADLAELEAVSGPTVPLGELVFVPTLPARVESLKAQVGSTIGGEESTSAGDQASTSSGPTPLAVLSSAGLQVDVGVSPTDVGLLEVGMDVELLDELSGASMPGVLTSLASEPTVDGAGGTLVEARVEGVGELPAEWSGRNVRVTFTAAATDGEVLVVPLAAVSAGADGQARVEVSSDGRTAVEVPVAAGLSADGFVAVEPSGGAQLAEGDGVVVGR